ncbi:MAG: hypothetical protein KF735_16630 [Chelatococcus sp.]|uniref:hypothetical protein n=1 Tax=Chelatococcus sp. TaxID=1953771 RepID=UPI0025C6E74F|nr:hypothetical protein [Chelatococcus sp.]MBX3539271.1 hypothetical protein [Chelatococcus sp.]
MAFLAVWVKAAISVAGIHKSDKLNTPNLTIDPRPAGQPCHPAFGSVITHGEIDHAMA